MSFYCPYCGEQLPDGSRFCSGCGSFPIAPALLSPIALRLWTWQIGS